MNVELLDERIPSKVMRFIDVHFVIIDFVSRMQKVSGLNVLLDFLSGFLMHLALDYLFY